jgi:hypothetical protein
MNLYVRRVVDPIRAAGCHAARVLTILAGCGVFAYPKEGSVRLDLTEPAKPALWRNGVPHDFMKHRAIFQPTDGGKAPVSLGWKERELHVEAGGYVFDGKLAETGAYTFTSTPAK